MSRADIEAQVARILRAKSFASSKHRRDFLSYTVEQVLVGKTDRSKEVIIGGEVFKRADFDPATDSIVRNTAAQVRSALKSYYEVEGKDDPIVISIPKGRYVPQITIRRARRLRWPWIVAAAMTALVAILGMRLLTVRARPVSNPAESRPRRLLGPAASEGRSPLRVRTPYVYGQFSISPDGKNLYALRYPDHQLITIFRVADVTVQRHIGLREAIEVLKMSRDGLSLLGVTATGTVLQIETGTGRLKEVARAGGKVLDIAATSDGSRLFLAMGYSGLKRINLRTGESAILSSIVCPKHVRLDPAEKYLYVGYECTGPRGRPQGHDTVDVYDVQTEHSVHIIGGDLPMVGGRPVISPNGEIVLLDAGDACETRSYDHLGCEKVPSTVFHVWRAPDRKTILSRSFDMLNGDVVSFLPDGNRVVLSFANLLVVWDWARNRVVESMTLPNLGASAVTPKGDRLFAMLEDGPDMLVFDAEEESCLPPATGLQNFYFADGSLDDSMVPTSLTGKQVEFAPGRVGQAFRLDGKASFLQALTGSAWCPYCWHEWSAALFVKFDSLEGEMTVLGIDGNPQGWNLRLYKSRGNRIAVSAGGSEFPMESAEPVQAGRWYHIAIAVTRDHRALFVNGKLEAQQPVGFQLRHNVTDETVFLGSSRGQHDFLRGLIDEVAVYNRELSSGEIGRLSAPCTVPAR